MNNMTRLAVCSALVATVGLPMLVQAKANPHRAEVNRKYDIAGCKAAHKAHESALRAEAEKHCADKHKSKLERFEYKPTNCDFSQKGKPPTYAVGKIAFSCAKN